MENQPRKNNPLPSRQVLDNLLKRIAAAEQLLNAHVLEFRDLRNDVTAEVASLEPEQLIETGIKTLAEIEKSAIYKELALCKGNKIKAALRLGIGKTTLYRKLKNYGIEANGEQL